LGRIRNLSICKIEEEEEEENDATLVGAQMDNFPDARL